MTFVLIDANVILDILTEDRTWRDWSEEALAKATHETSVLINPIVYAEISARFRRSDDVDAIVDGLRLTRDDLPWSAAFLAGRAHQAYRKRGGDRRSPMPDFFIGAHAAVARYRLLTRDGKRFRTYFPDVELITPLSA
jgi:predicted nucleic acid-binding protein